MHADRIGITHTRLLFLFSFHSSLPYSLDIFEHYSGTQWFDTGRYLRRCLAGSGTPEGGKLFLLIHAVTGALRQCGLPLTSGSSPVYIHGAVFGHYGEAEVGQAIGSRNQVGYILPSVHEPSSHW